MLDTPEYSVIVLGKVPQDKSILIVTFTEPDLQRPITIRKLEADFQALPQRLAAKGSIRLIVDFTGVTHVPSAVFGIVLQLSRDCELAGIMMRVCCLQPTVAKVFGLLDSCGLLAVFTKRHYAVMTPWEKTDTPATGKWWWPFKPGTP